MMWANDSALAPQKSEDLVPLLTEPDLANDPSPWLANSTAVPTNDTLAVTESEDALRRVLAIIGFVFGLEALAVNLFALWLFFTLPSCRNVHGRLCIVKTAADLPYALAMTFWWLPLSAFYRPSAVHGGLQFPHLLLVDFVIVTVTFTSYYIALHVEVLIVLARFTAVFYSFTFKVIFRRRFLTLILVFCVLLGIFPVVFSSFYKNCAIYYRPLDLNWDVLDLADYESPCADLHMTYVINYVHICLLAFFCIVMAVITVVKLHILNTTNLKQFSINTAQKAKRRHSEWVLLVVSITSPFVISLRSVSSLGSYFAQPFDSQVIENFVYNFVMDFIVVQSNAIIQLSINRQFWQFIRGDLPKEARLIARQKSDRAW